MLRHKSYDLMNNTPNGDFFLPMTLATVSELIFGGYLCFGTVSPVKKLQIACDDQSAVK